MTDDLKPQLVLRFGVTGHRPPRLPHAKRDPVKSWCADIFALANRELAAIHARADNAFDAGNPPAVKLVSSLAEGADVLAAEAALENGADLSVCLPFPAEVYARDFPATQWAITKGLIERAESVLALGDELGGKADAYEAAGRIVLSQCDILIAVWDGDAAQGKGGTAQIVTEALALDIPVIHVDLTKETPPSLIWRALADLHAANSDSEDIEADDALAQLPALIDTLCRPPGQEERGSLDNYLGATTQGARGYAWPLLLALTGARAWRRTTFRSAGPDGPRDHVREATASLDRGGRFSQTLKSLVAERYAHADAEAGSFALRYRSTFVSNYVMSGSAVLFALGNLLVPEAKLVLITLELVVILLILGKTHAGRRLNFHQSWLDRRQLAERLRMLTMTAPLARLGLREGEDGHHHPGWVHWYVRATARELGLPDAHFDHQYLAAARQSLFELIDEQAGYHRANTHAMAHADHQLHRAGDFLFFGTVLACGLFIIAYLVNRTALDGFGGAQLVTFVTALFPALGAALYGIRMQGDFANTSQRSAQITRRLQRLRAQIELEPLSYQGLVDHARSLREILLAEVQQWRTHFESRPLNLPG